MVIDVSIFVFIGFKVETTVDAAVVTWNEFNHTHSDASKFKKYEIVVEQSGVKVTEDASLDNTPFFEITPLSSSTEYEAKIRVILHEFGASELSDPITIRTLPAQLSGKLKLLEKKNHRL